MSLLQALRQPHALYLLQHAKALLPGIHRMVTCFYYDGKTQVWQLDAKEELPTPLNLQKEIPETLLHYRRQARQDWIAKEDLQFNFQSRTSLQKDVFEELDNNVLLLSFKNDIDHQYDCIFFYFNRDASNFGLRKKGEVLTTESKAVISNILKQSLNVSIKQRRSFEKEVNQYKNYLSKLSNQYKKAKEELDHFQVQSKEQTLDYCQSILNNLASETAYEIILTESAKLILSEYKGSRESLPAALTKAVQFAIYSSPGIDMITLEDWHLDLDNEQIVNQVTEKPVDVRYQKTYSYLNKLEEAARKAYSQHMKLTGKNVGLSMTQPISAPAITDALRNHQKNIYSLFELYPENWSLIRKEFKPITNLIENQAMRRISRGA